MESRRLFLLFSFVENFHCKNEFLRFSIEQITLFEMALCCRALSRNCAIIRNLTKPAKWNFQNVLRTYPVRVLSSGICYKNCYFIEPFNGVKRIDFISVRQCATQNVDKPPPEAEQKKGLKGLVLKFKEMYRDYWYVLLPVHMATSAIWFGSFYYAVRSGVDVISILESFGISESLMEPLKKSGAGYFALAFAMYKLITPLRYAVTVGGTTYAIRRLTAIGWIKPVPSRERIKEMLQEKKDNFQDRYNESKQIYQKQMKEKGTKVMDEMRRYKTEMRSLKNKKTEE